MNKNAFTLVELMIVVVIVGILTSLAIPNFTAAKEKTLDKEAIAAMHLIKVAERQYRLATNLYWPTTAVTNTNINQINGNLSLLLSSSNWVYEVRGAAGGATFRARATRLGRNWTINNTLIDPLCSGACY
ncbi:MAG: type II secretion system protein [Candidatus Omnitrophota bacterium]